MLPMVLTIAVVALVVLVINHESTTGAQRVRSEKEVIDVSYAAQAGKSHKIWQIQQAGCGPFTDIASASLGDRNYSAAVTTNNSGGNLTTIPVQVIADAYIKEDTPTLNYGTDAQLETFYKFLQNQTRRTLFKFDIENSGIPAGTVIVSAVAKLFVIDPNQVANVSVHQTTADWTENTVTWDNIANDHDTSSIATIPKDPPAGQYVDVNITSLVQGWINGTTLNYGIMLKTTWTDDLAQFASKDHGTSSQHPFLEITTTDGSLATRASVNATGALPNGISRTATRDDIGLYQPNTNYVWQPGPELEDAFIGDGVYATKNFGISPILNIKNDRNVLIRFNMGVMPPGARVIDAKLGLYLEGGSGVSNGVLDLHRINRDWAEGEYDLQDPPTGTPAVTYEEATNASDPWTTRGGDYDSSPIDSITLPSMVTGWYEWDVTELVKSWMAGDANYGLLIREGGGSAGDINFSSSDSPTETQRPQLSLTIACECGVSCLIPQGAGKVLLAVGDDVSLSDGDAYKKALFESWGYTVTLIGDNANQTTFDSAVGNNDIAYVSATVSGWTLGDKLTNAGIGVVNEEGDVNDNLGFSSGRSNPVTQTITVTDNSHYITTLFPLGAFPIYSAAMEGLTVSGVNALGLQQLADTQGAGSVVVLDQGATMENGGSAAGRRVMVPVGPDSKFNWRYLNNNGRLIVQRALQWGTGNTVILEKNLLLVVVDPTNLTPQETAKRSLIQSWGYTVELIDVNADQASFDAAVANNNVAFITEDINSGDLGTKLVNATIGVVTEETNLSDEFGLSDGINWDSGTQIEINDNTHYITSPFPTGLLTVLTTSETLAYATPTFAPDLMRLASSASGYGVIAVDADAAVTAGGFAAGRRVMLPWGGNDMDVNHLNADGLTIFQRALDWGAEAIPSDPIYLSSGSAATLGGLNFDDIDIAEYDPDGDSANLFFEGALTTLVSDIDALHVLEDGHILLSTKDDASLGGLSFLDGDLVKYNPATDTATLYFDESTFSANEDIISVYVMDSGHILLSTDSDATLGGLNFTDNDLVEYDPGSNTATLYFDGSATTLVSDIDAVHLLKNSHIILSTKDDASLGGLSFKDGDLVDYNPATDTAVLYFDEGLFTDNEDVISVHAGPGSGGVPVPIAHWKLDETSGPTAVDSEGGNDGTLAGNPTWSAGTLGNALDFDGLGDRVDVGPVLDAATPQISVTAWVYKRDSGDDRVISKSTGTNIPDHIFSLGVANTTIRVRLKTTDNGGTSNYDGGVMPLDQWVHLAFTYDGSQLKIYRDGVETASFAVTGAMVASSQNVAIGNVNAIDDRYWNGLLDDVRIYDRALYPFEIADLVAAGGGGGGGGGGNLRDEFATDSFSNNDGTLNWSGDWIEVDDAGAGATSGNAQISGGVLNLDDAPDTSGEPSLMREADLSAYTTATLTFTYSTTSGVDSDDTVVLDISDNGGSSWTTLETFLGPVSGSANYDISAYIAANSQIRFRVTSLYGGSNEQFLVDDLDIAVTGP